MDVMIIIVKKECILWLCLLVQCDDTEEDALEYRVIELELLWMGWELAENKKNK